MERKHKNNIVFIYQNPMQSEHESIDIITSPNGLMQHNDPYYANLNKLQFKVNTPINFLALLTSNMQIIVKYFTCVVR